MKERCFTSRGRSKAVWVTHEEDNQKPRKKAEEEAEEKAVKTQTSVEFISDPRIDKPVSNLQTERRKPTNNLGTKHPHSSIKGKADLATSLNLKRNGESANVDRPF